jgi:hypothetical protein
MFRNFELAMHKTFQLTRLYEVANFISVLKRWLDRVDPTPIEFRIRVVLG